MRIVLPKAKTVIKWKSIALAASILCSIAELANIQTAEKSGYIAAASQQEIEIAKLSLSIATDARLLASKTNGNENKNEYQHIYTKNICKVERLVDQAMRSISKQHPQAKICTTNQNGSITEISVIEGQLASKIDEWENNTRMAANEQTQHTSTALQLNYLATILLLLFLALDLFDTYGMSHE